MRRNRNSSQGELICVALMVILLVTSSVMAQKSRPKSGENTIELGRGMSLLTADLMQIAARSDLFLRVAEKINLTIEQQKKLEEMYFNIQQYSVRREADLNVADAELRRLLTAERVDLAAVRVKVKEAEAIQTEATIKNIELALQAIGILTHEQHIRVMLLVRESPQPEQQSGWLR